MKKRLVAIALLTVFVLSLTSVAFAAPPADKTNWKAGLTPEQLAQMRGRAVKDRLKVNGKLLEYDVPPVIKEDRTLIPVRAITNGLGAEVTWDPEARTVTIVRDDTTVVLTLGEMTLLVNGEEVEMDVPAQLISNRTFVPLRFIAQALGDRVDYDDDTGDINIAGRLETPRRPVLAANIATWTAVANENNGYTLRLFRGDELVTSVTVAHGAALSYDFSSLMTASGSYAVRVTALGTGEFSDSKESKPSLPQTVGSTVPAPVAPTVGVVDDNANTFGWTAVAGYPNADRYEYSTNEGSTWTTCTVNPQPVGDSNYAAGDVMVRVRADASTGRPAGAALASTAAFTATTTTIEGSVVAISAPVSGQTYPEGTIGLVSVIYTKDETTSTRTFAVTSTVQILVNTQASQFSGIQIGDAAKATLQNDVLVKIEITR